MNKNIFKQNNLKFNMLDKRGQGLSTNAIILIILGVVVLLILIVGFTLGWDKIAPFLKTNNIETIKTSCVSACATGNTYGFCTQNRTLKAEGVTVEDKTCFEFATNTSYEPYGIDECGSITCS
jgi:hypothetical protein